MACVRVHHLDCGTLCPLAAPLVGSPGHLWQRGLMVCHCLLVETDHGLLLVDAGLGTSDLGAGSRLPLPFRMLTKPRADGPTALSHVQRLGFERKDVRHVLPTHLDLDHAGGLSDFPEASVHLHEVELKSAESPSRREAKRYLRAQWRHGPRWQPYPTPGGDDWFGFASVRPLTELGDDVAIVPLAGHSAGHAGIAVRTRERWILHAGDAFFHASELEPGSRSPVGLRLFQRFADSDHQVRVRNTERLRALHARHSDEVRVVCAHDPALLAACQG